MANNDEKILKALEALQADVSTIKKDVQDHTRRLRGVKMILTRVRKDVSYIIKDFDTRIVENRRSIERLEAGLSKN